MKRLLFLLFAVSVLGGVCGCLHNQVVCNDDPGIESGSCCRKAHCWPPCDICCRERAARAAPALPPQQPPVAAVTYPYYTLRGPRDFLQREPSPIGP